VFANISNKDLPVKRDKKKRQYQKVRIAHKNLRGTSIEERPLNIEDREEYGHWEMDCVVGKQLASLAPSEFVPVKNYIVQNQRLPINVRQLNLQFNLNTGSRDLTCFLKREEIKYFSGISGGILFQTWLAPSFL
jgi:hypothetical protein